MGYWSEYKYFKATITYYKTLPRKIIHTHTHIIIHMAI